MCAELAHAGGVRYSPGMAKIDPSDILVALLLVVVATLIGVGAVPSSNLDALLAGVLGYIARGTLK